ncbi:hypothetical protein F5Y11DRAFT_353354 [Daldinia sp. FL1419]|nr:hypothetical protein F5Y11DRAFT_353354 [Daldinia sp. FL1419]
MSSSAGPSSLSRNSSSTSIHAEPPNTMLGFSMPEPDFDPTNNHAMASYYKNKEEKGVLADEDSIDVQIEQEAERRVKEWERLQGRVATEEEREWMMDTVRRSLGNAWLEGAKAQLVGKTEVPIAWFNHIVAENEQVVQYVAGRSIEVSLRRQEANETINELTEENERLKEALAAGQDDPQLKFQIAKLKEENAALREKGPQEEGEMTLLRDQLTEARKREEKLQEKLNKQESDLRLQYRRSQKLEEKVEALEDSIRQGRVREDVLKRDNSDLEAQITKLRREVEDLRADTDKEYEPVQSITTKTGSTDEPVEMGPSEINTQDFDMIRLLRELKEAKTTHADLSAESNELITWWMGRVADNDKHNLLEFYAAVVETRQAMVDLGNRIVALRSGLDDNTRVAKSALTAEEAMSDLENMFKEQEKGPLNVQMTNMKLLAEVHQLEIELETETVKNDTLNMKLEMAKPDEQIDMEVRMQYGIHEETELRKRVDAETQSFRMHRRELVDRIVSCRNSLYQIAISCSDLTAQQATIDLADTLAILNLPRPKLQAAR